MKPIILMYHSIDDKKLKRLKGIRVSPKNFERQIRYFYNKGYKSHTLCEAIEQRDRLDNKSIILTFDDGYRDNFTNAFEILKKYGFKATIFLIINRFDNDWSVHRKEKNAGIVDKIDKLSDDEIKIMLKSGLIEIGAHTLNHKNFKKLSKEEKIYEIEKSKEEIEKRFDIECKTFSYPFGIYEEGDEKLVENAGFIGAVTTETARADLQRDNLFLLPRVNMKDEYLKFLWKIRGLC